MCPRYKIGPKHMEIIENRMNERWEIHLNISEGRQHTEPLEKAVAQRAYTKQSRAYTKHHTRDIFSKFRLK